MTMQFSMTLNINHLVDRPSKDEYLLLSCKSQLNSGKKLLKSPDPEDPALICPWKGLQCWHLEWFKVCIPPWKGDRGMFLEHEHKSNIAHTPHLPPREGILT